MHRKYGQPKEHWESSTSPCASLPAWINFNNIWLRPKRRLLSFHCTVPHLNCSLVPTVGYFPILVKKCEYLGGFPGEMGTDEIDRLQAKACFARICSTWHTRDYIGGEHVLRTCLIDLWFRHVILGLVQQIQQFTVQFALLSFDILHNQNRIFMWFCLTLLFLAVIQPFLFTSNQNKCHLVTPSLSKTDFL